MPATGRPLTLVQSIVLLSLNVYFDSSVSLWQQLYKDTQANRMSDGCKGIIPKCPTKDPGCRLLVEQLLNIPPASGGAAAGTTTSTTNTTLKASAVYIARRLKEPEVEDDEDLLHEKKVEVGDCSWFVQRDENGKWAQRPQTFTKGAALSLQATVGLAGYYTYNYVAGGKEQLMMCFNIKQLCLFAPVGLLFGLGAVFSFLAQDALSPGSYALYAQSGIIAIPVMWRVVFRKEISSVTWVHILLIALGIVMYRISEFDMKESFGGVGLFWVSMKVVGTAMATCWAEVFLKSPADADGQTKPLAVQITYILPWKIMSTMSTVWLLPPHGLPDRPGGIFHDWSVFTVLTISHNLGDTVMSATIAKSFDSVVKAVCGVVGIIFPTWVVSWWVGWDRIDVGTTAGQLKMSGGTIVVVAAIAYALGRGQWDELVRLRDAAWAASPDEEEKPPEVSHDLELAEDVPQRERGGTK